MWKKIKGLERGKRKKKKRDIKPSKGKDDG